MKAGPRGRWGRGRALLRVLVLVLFPGLAFAPPALSAQVSVEELELHFQLAAGRGPLTQLVPVRNELDRAQQVRVVLGDWQRDSLGRNEFLAPGTHAASCRERLQVFPMTFQLAPGAVEYVRVTYDPAADLAGCWSIVFFETVSPPQANPDRPGSFLTIEVRTGVKAYVHAAAAEKRGEITVADVVQAWQHRTAASGARDSSQVWQADLRFANTGTEHLKVRASVEVRDRSGKLLHKVAAPEALLTPRAVRDLAIPLPELVAGDYLAVLLVDFGGDEITAAQVEFRIP